MPRARRGFLIHELIVWGNLIEDAIGLLFVERAESYIQTVSHDYTALDCLRVMYVTTEYLR